MDVENKHNTNCLAKGLIERIGFEDGVLTHKPQIDGKARYEVVQPIPDHSVGINLVLSALTDAEHGVIESLSEIGAAGHRVAHGGEYFSDSAIVTPLVKEQIKSIFDLAPLHNPPALKGIESVEKLMPTIEQVAVFDTSFHASMPKENFLYALPYEYYEQKRIRKYGFHGTSHKYVAQKACEMVGLDFETSKVITCHIGNGASITAIENGKSIDTSMGFTPVDGLMMGTRCGMVDPSALLYIMNEDDLTANKINDLINKKSGLQGVSGVSSDMRDILAASKDGHERAQLAKHMFSARIKHFVGAYFAELGGADLVVFTGGIGENESHMRHDVLYNLQAMGIELDDEANLRARGVDTVITKPESKVKAVVACTDEELVIATDTYRLLRA